jgi:BASS family bile acid:Na+ symporter
MKWIKTGLLPLAIVLGFLFPGAGELSWMVKWLLAAMVFLAFMGPISVSLHEARALLLRTLPIWLVLPPILYALARLLVPSWPDFAWAIFLVSVAPTATAAPAVVRMRGGEPSIVVAGVVLSHVLVGFVVPLWAALFGNGGGPTLEIPRQIFSGTLPLVILPLALAFGVRRFAGNLSVSIGRLQPYSIFLWALAVLIVVAKARGVISNESSQSGGIKIIMIAFASLVLCVGQFGLGRRLSSKFPEESAQILGQKNTILVIWIASTWFGAWASLGPIFYVIWQNLYIAWQTAFPRLKNP